MHQKAYSYDSETGEYMGEVECQPSPLEPGKFLHPAFTFSIAPPVTAAHQVACAVDGDWVIKADYRGTWYREDRIAVEIKEIGVEASPGWTKTPMPFSLTEAKAQLVVGIDDEVATIYHKYTRFQGEYELREAQAQAFKDAGYTGEVPPQVAAFATPAGLDTQTATDTILAQAANLRGALAQLGVLRMRKYEVINAADLATAQTKHDEIIIAISAIGAALS